MDYHFNHTCHTDFASCKFLQSGIMNAPGEGGGTEDEGVDRSSFYCSYRNKIYFKGETHQCRGCKRRRDASARCRVFCKLRNPVSVCWCVFVSFVPSGRDVGTVWIFHRVVWIVEFRFEYAHFRCESNLFWCEIMLFYGMKHISNSMKHITMVYKCSISMI